MFRFHGEGCFAKLQECQILQTRLHSARRGANPDLAVQSHISALTQSHCSLLFPVVELMYGVRIRYLSLASPLSQLLDMDVAPLRLHHLETAFFVSVQHETITR